MFAFVACDAQNWMQWKFVWCAATTVCEWQTNKTSQLAAVCSSAAREIIIKQKTVPQYNRRRVTNACSAFALMLYAFVTGCALQFTQFLFAFHSDDVTHTVHPWLCLFLFIYVDVRRKNRKIRLSSILMIFVIVFDFFFVSFSSHTHSRNIGRCYTHTHLMPGNISAVSQSDRLQNSLKNAISKRNLLERIKFHKICLAERNFFVEEIKIAEQ